MKAKRRSKAIWIIIAIIAGSFLIVATLVGVLFLSFQRAQNKNIQVDCMSNMKGVTLAILMFTQDFGVLPDALRVHPQLAQRLRNNPRSWSPIDHQQYPLEFQVWPYLPDSLQQRMQNPCYSNGTYAMNHNLSGMTLDQIESGYVPLDTVLLYEVDADGKPANNIHSGGANYGFVDGRVKWISAKEASTLKY